MDPISNDDFIHTSDNALEVNRVSTTNTSPENRSSIQITNNTSRNVNQERCDASCAPPPEMKSNNDTISSLKNSSRWDCGLEESNATLHIFLTGFGPFAGVEKNPTSLVCDFVKRNAHLFPQIQSSTIVRVSCIDSNNYFHNISSTIREIPSTDRVLLLHLGVASNADTFRLERFAYNEMTFNVEDEQGFKPQKVPIRPQFTLEYSQKTKINLTLLRDEVNQRLENALKKPSSPTKATYATHDESLQMLTKSRPECTISDDPGRFVCNYTYFRSMETSEQFPNVASLFVHVPSLTSFPETIHNQFFYILYLSLMKLYAA